MVDGVGVRGAGWVQVAGQGGRALGGALRTRTCCSLGAQLPGRARRAWPEVDLGAVAGGGGPARGGRGHKQETARARVCDKVVAGGAVRRAAGLLGCLTVVRAASRVSDSEGHCGPARQPCPSTMGCVCACVRVWCACPKGEQLPSLPEVQRTTARASQMTAQHRQHDRTKTRICHLVSACTQTHTQRTRKHVRTLATRTHLVWAKLGVPQLGV